MILDYSQFIEHKGEEGIVNFNFVNNTMDKLQKIKGYCPFCKSIITNKIYNKTNSNIYWCSATEYEEVVQCPQCGWWEHSYTFSSDDVEQGLRANSIELTQAILRTYCDDSKDIPIEVLNKYITQNPEKIYNINDNKMEELVSSVFKDFDKYKNFDVKLVGKSHDGGKDLILLNGDKQTFVQVKRRMQANKVESVSSIRDLIGASILGDATACIFVTTADHFSKSAQNAAHKIVDKKILDSFELIDYHKFTSMLKLQASDYPRQWEKLLRIKNI
jgi:hypothetical protein